MTASPALFSPHFAASREGVTTFEHTRIWAEQGLICWEDTRTGEYGAMHPDDFKWRLVAINDMTRNSVRRHQGDFFPDQIRDHQRFVQAGSRVYQLALEQGAPGDKQAVEERKRRRPKTFLVKAGQSFQDEL